MRKLGAAVKLVFSFVYALVVANLAVARTVLSPSLDIRPGVVAFPTTLSSDRAITTLANMITLTPGTLTVDVSEDRRTLFIHTLNIVSSEEVVASIRRTFERHISELER